MTTFAIPVPGRRQAKLINTFESLATWATDIDRFNEDVSESFTRMGRAVTILTTRSTPVTGAIPAHAATHAPGGSDAILTGSPVAVGSANAAGTGLALIRNDHVHQGIHSIDAGGTDLYGDLTFAASGTGLTVGQVGQTITYTLAAGSGSGLDADTLDGLDSTDFIKKDGTIALTADWNAGVSTWDIQALVFKTEPWVVMSGVGGRVYLSMGTGRDAAIAGVDNGADVWQYAIADNGTFRIESYLGTASYAGATRALVLTTNSGVTEFAVDGGSGRFGGEHFRLGPYSTGNHNSDITLSPRGTGTSTFTVSPSTAGYFTLVATNDSTRISSTSLGAGGRPVLQAYGDNAAMVRNIFAVDHIVVAAPGQPFAVSPYGVTGPTLTASTSGDVGQVMVVNLSGQNDLIISGTYSGTSWKHWKIRIVTGGGGTNTWEYSLLGGDVGTYSAGGSCGTSPSAPIQGLTFKWTSATGHTAGDTWEFRTLPARNRVAFDANSRPIYVQAQNNGAAASGHAFIFDTTAPITLGGQDPYLFLVNGFPAGSLGGSANFTSVLSCYVNDNSSPVIRWRNNSNYADMTYSSVTNMLSTTTAFSLVDLHLVDNAKIHLGTGDDAEVYYDGTDLILDPDVVGTGALAVKGNTINLGASSAADVVLNFKGGTYDGAITWADSANGFKVPYYLSVGGAGILDPYYENCVFNSFTARPYYNEDSAAIGAWAINYAASTTVNYIAYGIKGQTQWILQVAAGKGDCYGCLFSTRISNVSGVGDGSNSLVGAKFSVDSSGTCDSNNIGLLAGGWLVASPTGDSNLYHDVVGILLDVQPTGTNNTVDSMYGLYLAAFNNAGSGNTVNAAYGAYFVDVTNLEAAPVSGALDVIHIEAQDGTASAATCGNVRFAGGNYNTGHVQLENGHVWNDATNNAITFKGSAPANETDGVGVTGGTIAAGTAVGTLTNGPWTTTPKNPNAWLELYIGGTRYAVPAWNLA